MEERLKMYSCIIHKEVEVKGCHLTHIANLLGITYQHAYRLMRAYEPSFEEYNAMTLTRIINQRKNTKKMLTQIKTKAERLANAKYVDKAFFMPITKGEKIAFDKIKEQVFNDEYLPMGYRKPQEPERFIEDKNQYERIEIEQKPEKRSYRTEWTCAMISEMKALYPTTLSRVLADKYKISVYCVDRKARELGLEKSQSHISFVRGNANKKNKQPNIQH